MLKQRATFGDTIEMVATSDSGDSRDDHRTLGSESILVKRRDSEKTQEYVPQ